MAPGLLNGLADAFTCTVKSETFSSLNFFSLLQMSDWHCDLIACPASSSLCIYLIDIASSKFHMCNPIMWFTSWRTKSGQSKQKIKWVSGWITAPAAARDGSGSSRIKLRKTGGLKLQEQVS